MDSRPSQQQPSSDNHAGLTMKPLAAHEQAEMLAKKKGGSAVETFLVKPDYAYPGTRMNRNELREEMNKPSSYFHDLRRCQSRTDNEIGLLKLEILQCIGLPRLDAVGENDTFCLAVCGSYAFKTDILTNMNPMWLSRMRRACLFPLYNAYARLYVGVFDDDGENEKDDFAGRIVLDVARVRPNCTYDVTLPLRQSSHVYMRRPRGSVRIRFHLSWYNERSAVLSYLPITSSSSSSSSKSGGGGFAFGHPHETVTVNCCDKKSFQNVALTVHGTHPQGRFSMKVVKALVREINFTRVHVLRYIRKREIQNLIGWKYPIISGFWFCSWMHSVYANTVRYLPGNFITLFLLYLWKNYGNYAINSTLQRGFLPPTWEEICMALLCRSSERRQYIEPLEMATASGDDAGTRTTSGVEGLDGSSTSIICCSGGYTLNEVAKAFREGVRVSNNRYRLRVFEKTFLGSEAVDFLVNNGYATTREEAVLIGRQLMDKKKLFEHIHHSHNTEFKDDARCFYHFMNTDDKKYTFRTHKPWGKALLRMVGFLDESSFSEVQLEMPYSSGKDHPRFTVKESLVIRSKDSRSMMEKLMAEDDEDADAVELGMEGSMGFDPRAATRQMEKFDSYFDLGREPFVESQIEDSQGEGEEDATIKVLKKPPLQNIDFKPKSDKAMPDVLAEARDKVHGILFHCFNDPTYVVRDRNTETFASDSTGSNCRKLVSDASLASIPESASNKGFRVPFQRKRNSSDKSNKSARSKSFVGPTKEDHDRALKTGIYSNSNRWVAKVGVIVQPIVEIAYGWIFLFRALFNIFTWQDVYVNFWISVICPIVVVVLHLFPWRIVLGISGIVLFGPQNWLFRVIRERKGVPPPDLDRIVRSKKSKEEGVESEQEGEVIFCNDTDQNRPVDYAALDRTNVRHVAVPYSPLLYNHRFYDWPPEPDYARVLKDDPQSESIIEPSHVEAKSTVCTVKRNTSTASTNGRRNWRKINAVVRLAPRRSKEKGA